jgi:hypothetical protein
LSPINFELLPALVVDLLHEFEIGVWKTLFIHLIRLLDAHTGTQRDSVTLTAELDVRFVRLTILASARYQKKGYTQI